MAARRIVRRVLRIVRRIALVLTTLALLAVVTALIVVHTDWGRNKIRKRIVAAMSETFPGGVSIRTLEGSVTGDAVLRDIVIKDRAGRPAIQIDRIELNVKLLSLLSRTVRLEYLHANGVTVDAHRAHDGTVNLVDMLALSDKPFGWDLALDDVRVNDAKVNLDLDGKLAHLEGIVITGSLARGRDKTLDATIDLQGRWKEQMAGVLAQGQIHVADGVITAPGLTLGIDGATVTGSSVRFAGPLDASGTFTIEVAAGSLQRFYPQASPNPAIKIGFLVEPNADRSALTAMVTGTAGKAAMSGVLSVNPTAWPARLIGVVNATGANVQAFAVKAVPTEVSVTAIVGLVLADKPGGGHTMTGFVGAVGNGTVGSLQVDHLYAQAVSAGDLVTVLATADSPGESHARADGRLRFGAKGAIQIEHVHAVANIGEIAKVAPFAGLTGGVDADVDLSGVVWAGPPQLTIDGRITGHHLRRDTMRAGLARLDLDHVHVDFATPTRPSGKATLVVTAGSIDHQTVPTTTLTATARLDGSYRVGAHSAGDHLGPGGEPWSVDADAVVRPGAGFRTATVHLGNYALRTHGVPWSGTGGDITIGPARVTVRGVAGTIDGGRFAIDGDVSRRGGDLSGTVTTTGVDLAQLDDALGLTYRGIGPLRGESDLAIELHRKRGVITGTAKGAIRGLVIRYGADPVDVAIDAAVEPDRIAGHLTVKGHAVGDLDLVVDVDPPADITDLRQWARLERKEIRTASVHATSFDIAAIAGLIGVRAPIEGKLDIDVELGPTGQVGTIRARDLIVDRVPAMIDFDATLDLADPAVVALAATASLRELAHGSIQATLQIPSRPFDAAAWAALDLRAFKGATITVDEVAIDDMLAARFGLGSVRGWVAGSVEITEGAQGIRARAVARRITGGPLARPVDLLIDGTLDDTGATATMTGSVDGVAFVTAEATAPIDPDKLRADARATLAAVPITGKATILPTKINPLLAMFGQTIKMQGTVHGDGTFAGTVGAPTATVALMFENVGGKSARIKTLKLDAGYSAGKLTATLDGKQEAGGTLYATATYEIHHPEASAATVKAHQFQLAPLLRMIPNLVGVRGVVDADLAVGGADAAHGKAEGVLKIRELQLPITDEIGAITAGKLDLSVTSGHATLELLGSIESGDVKLDATADLDGLLPRNATLDVRVRNLAIISTMAPQIAAQLHADVKLTGDHWTITSRLYGGKVLIPDQAGRPLHPASPPTDLVFLENGKIKTPARTELKQLLGQPPSHPFARIAIAIEPIRIESKQLRGQVSGNLAIDVGDDGIAVGGEIDASTGEVMVFDRRYVLEHAAIYFDRTQDPLDPTLDIQIQHDFAEFTMRVAIHGKLSDPSLQFDPSSDYTAGQQLGFLLGGTPGGPAQDSKDMLTGAAASVASQTIGGFVTRRLPVKIDVLRFEPATTTSSASFTAGRWVSDRILVLLRSRISPREDENRAESEMEFWLGRRVVLDGSGGDKGVLGLDLLWTRRW